MKYARQRDKNEREIIDALVARGAAVQQLDGAGVPDLLVSFGGVLTLIEVKNPLAKGGGKYNTGEGSLTAGQSKWWAKWRGKQPVIVHSVDEAIAVIESAAADQRARDEADYPIQDVAP